jgi:hypothetical protein
MEQFLPFEEALVHVRSWKLEGKSEWEAWAKSSARSANVPSLPEKTYVHAGWQGYEHWLGTGNELGGQKHGFLPVTEALAYAHALKLKGLKDWQAWCKTGARPENVPSRPDKVCKHDGWQSWGTGWAPASLLEAN